MKDLRWWQIASLAAGTALALVACLVLAIGGYDPAVKWLFVFSAIFVCVWGADWIGIGDEDWVRRHRWLLIGVGTTVAVGGWLAFFLWDRDVGLMLVIVAAFIVSPVLLGSSREGSS